MSASTSLVVRIIAKKAINMAGATTQRVASAAGRHWPYATLRRLDRFDTLPLTHSIVPKEDEGDSSGDKR
jgi:hypothetical protein